MYKHSDDSKILQLCKNADVGYESFRDILLENQNNKKKIELLKEFVEAHINLIEKELNKDGWCTLSVDYETLEKFKNILKSV